MLPDCQFALFESNGSRPAHALAVKPEVDASSDAGEPLQAGRTASTPERSTGTYAVRYPLSWTNYDGV